jgi:hypothetical protein
MMRSSCLSPFGFDDVQFMKDAASGTIAMSDSDARLRQFPGLGRSLMSFLP